MCHYIGQRQVTPIQDDDAGIDRLALFGFIEMFVFLAILLVGYLYAWRRGALEWA